MFKEQGSGASSSGDNGQGVDGLGGNLLCKSEDKKGKAAPEQKMKTKFETAAGRGVYASRYWRKAVTYSAPLLYPTKSEAVD